MVQRDRSRSTRHYYRSLVSAVFQLGFVALLFRFMPRPRVWRRAIGTDAASQSALIAIASRNGRSALPLLLAATWK